MVFLLIDFKLNAVFNSVRFSLSLASGVIMDYRLSRKSGLNYRVSRIEHVQFCQWVATAATSLHKNLGFPSQCLV